MLSIQGILAYIVVTQAMTSTQSTTHIHVTVDIGCSFILKCWWITVSKKYVPFCWWVYLSTSNIGQTLVIQLLVWIFFTTACEWRKVKSILNKLLKTGQNLINAINQLRLFKYLMYVLMNTRVVFDFPQYRNAWTKSVKN